jgi:hypothetical protein
LAASAWRESLARSERIQSARRATSGTLRLNDEAFLGRTAVDLALDVEDRINLLHRFEREWRNEGSLPRAFALTSASMKNLRLAWAQQAASLIGSGERSPA